MSNMLNIVLFGPPGAGKGTQSQKLIEKYGLVHLSTGDLLRSEISRGTALGMEAKQLMDRGDLVGDDIVIGMIESKLDANPHANGFIFDGFPRTQAQAVALDDLLQKKGTAISAMIALEVDNEELVRRLLSRGKESGRPDDQNEEIIRNRVNEYNNKTLPLKKYYSEQAKFHSINGIGNVEAIFNEIINRIVFIQAEIELTMLENDIEHLDMTINDFEVATEISDELKHDIEEVRKGDNKVATAKKVAQKKAASKKEKAPIKKEDKKKTTKKIIAKKQGEKSAPKKAVKKVVKKVSPKKRIKNNSAKKDVKKVVAKKPVKKGTVKKVVTKKPVKKVNAKKAVTKKPIAKKVVLKKPVKKVAPKKIVIKKSAKKVGKNLAPKKAIKKVVKKKK